MKDSSNVPCGNRSHSQPTPPKHAMLLCTHHNYLVLAAWCCYPACFLLSFFSHSPTWQLLPICMHICQCRSHTAGCTAEEWPSIRCCWLAVLAHQWPPMTSSSAKPRKHPITDIVWTQQLQHQCKRLRCAVNTKQPITHAPQQHMTWNNMLSPLHNCTSDDTSEKQDALCLYNS